MRLSPKQCARCGLVFEKKGFRKYCDDCRLIVRREHDRARREKEKGKPKPIKPPKPKPHISQIDRLVKEARAAGVSYGRYVAMQYIKEGC